jgi:uncharacterized protein (TIGR03083 family)
VIPDLPVPLPAGVRDRVLATARAARAPGRSLPEVPPIAPAEAFSRAADALFAVLSALDAAQWRRPVLRDLDVQGLVGHLTGVEHDVQRALDGDPVVGGADHVASTQPEALRQAGRPPERTGRDWRAAADCTVALVSARGTEDAGDIVRLHGMRLPLGALMVVRAFELWTHENDIRAAVGLTASAPDPSTLRLMTELAVQLLPVGMARAGGRPDPVDLHLVLTGAGGGTWDVALAERAGESGVPDVAVVADAVGFCRLVANRIGPDELRAHLSGAVVHAGRVLAGAAALALD